MVHGFCVQVIELKVRACIFISIEELICIILQEDFVLQLADAPQIVLHKALLDDSTFCSDRQWIFRSCRALRNVCEEENKFDFDL